MRSDTKATTVEEYLASLPEERRIALSLVRDVVRQNLPEGYVETMNWGMISYEVPLSTYPETYNGQPLMYAALASQKKHMALYLTGIYMSDERRAEFARRVAEVGKKLDAGKSCVRFKSVDDLPLELIAEVIASETVEEFCARFEGMRGARKAKNRAGKKTSGKKKSGRTTK